MTTEQNREYVCADSLRCVTLTLVSDVRDVTLWGEESNPATGKERQVNDSDKDSFALLWGRWDETRQRLMHSCLRYTRFGRSSSSVPVPSSGPNLTAAVQIKPNQAIQTNDS